MSILLSSYEHLPGFFLHLAQLNIFSIDFVRHLLIFLHNLAIFSPQICHLFQLSLDLLSKLTLACIIWDNQPVFESVDLILKTHYDFTRFFQVLTTLNAFLLTCPQIVFQAPHETVNLTSLDLAFITVRGETLLLLGKLALLELVAKFLDLLSLVDNSELHVCALRLQLFN